MYRCLGCGHLFEDGEQKTYRENVGECHGTPAYMDYSVCPVCGGDYVEMEECEICGEHYLGEELLGGVCKDCIDKHRHDFELCEKINGTEVASVKIDAFLATQFGTDEINNLLRWYLHNKATYTEIDCSEFIDNDITWFAEELSKEINN